MEYHAITHNDYCVIRPAYHGVNDIEWQHGCRSFYRPDCTRVEVLKLTSGYYVLDDRQWSDYIGSLDEPGFVPNNNFISTRATHDKWDSNRPIY
jgi:hypothetical protein